MSTRRVSGQGKAIITIDVRSSTDGSYWSNCGNLLVLLGLLAEIAGPKAEVFFDFGVITIKEVDLAEFVRRFDRPDRPPRAKPHDPG